MNKASKSSVQVIYKLIPELRFPEFVDEGEWEDKQVDKLGETLNGLSGKSGEDFGVGKPYVTYKQVFDNSIIDFLKCGKVNIGENENQNPLHKGDILFTTSSETPNEVGIASILLESPKEATYLNSFCFALRPFDIKEILPEFSRYLFHTPIYRKLIVSLAQGSTRYNISKGAFKNLKLPIPETKEQIKIAACLSSLDEVITAQNHKLEALKDHRKGLMQNLFPQEGEKVPKLRFLEFAENGEWVEKNLDGICKLVRGPFGGSLKKEIFVKDGYAVYEQSHAIYGDFNSFRYYIDDKKYSELKRFSVKNGDLIMSCSGTMGKFALIPQNYNVGVINQALLKLTIKKGFNNIFVKMTLEAENNQNKLLSQSAGGAIKNVVSVSQIKELELLIPSIEEQQKIASCFSSLDHIITAQTEQIEQLKLHKKGLMQGLFPKNKT